MRWYRFPALLLALALAACGGGGSDDGEGEFPGGVGSKAVTVFDPLAGSVPFPINLLFAGFADPTLNIQASATTPVLPSFVLAANELDGFSTTASAFTDLTGFVDYATVPQGLVIVDSASGQPLRYGVDFTVQSSPAIDPADNTAINAKRSRILIEPLKPLKPSTTYLVALTTAVKSTAGEPIGSADHFRVVRSSTPVSQQTEPVLALATTAQKQTLEQIRQQFQPMMQAFNAAGLATEAIAIAWPFTTESTTLTLQRLNDAATPRPLTLFPTGLSSTGSPFNLPPPAASVFVGQFALPYYLFAPSAQAPTAPLSGFWQADATQPNLSASFLGQVPCGAFASGATINGQTAHASTSTTICYPLPVQQGTQTVPVLLSLPQTAMPASGWPAVIFQHGITRNRSDMLGLVPALTQAGFAVIAIDLPLHGIRPSDATAGLRVSGTVERSFDVDYVSNASGAPGPDGQVDASGTHFINLASLLTLRDNLRQGAIDLVNLARSLVPRDGSGNGALFVNPQTGSVLPIQFDTARVYFVGHSLGGIVGGTFLGVNGDVRAATLAMAGGGIAKLLDASASFGPRIAAGLAASGVREGTDTYETFLRFAQQAVDAGDPANYASAASAAHPLHLIEVVGDAVVPNCALPADATCPGIDTVTIAGYLSGTTPLARLMGLTFRPGPGETGALQVPVASPTVLLGPAARHNLVRFAVGEHGTILSPDASTVSGADTTLLPVLQEMQRQTASFLASDGLCLPIGSGCGP